MSSNKEHSGSIALPGASKGTKATGKLDDLDGHVNTHDEFVVLFCLHQMLSGAIDYPISYMGEALTNLDIMGVSYDEDTIIDGLQSLQSVIQERMQETMEGESG